MQFGSQALPELGQVLVLHLARAFLLAHEGEEEGGVHAFGGFFHLLSSDDAAEIFAENDIDAVTEPGEESDGIDARRDEQQEEWSKTEKDALLHATKPLLCEVVWLVCELQGDATDVHDQRAAENTGYTTKDPLPAKVAMRDGSSVKLDFHDACTP
jgi:hypothetical protein